MKKLQNHIQNCRNAAVKSLKLSRKDMAHGLELHRQAIVMDAFCLGFPAPVDGRALKKAMLQGASAAEISDMTLRMSMSGWLAPKRREELKLILKATGFTGYWQNVENDAAKTGVGQFARLANYIALKQALPDIFAPGGVMGMDFLSFSMNHVPLAYEFKSIVGELRHLEACRNSGIRMMHLTYNRQNMIGAGCYERSDGGLSDFGRKTVRKMNELGIIPDVAHCGWRTSEDAARVSNAPVVASHTVCCGLNEHPRGKPDRVLKAIAGSGGYVGICCVPPFLGGSGDIAALLDHIVYAVKKIGADHVAIGTDRNFSGPASKVEAGKYPRPSKFFKGSVPPSFESGFEFGCGEQYEPSACLRTMELVNWPVFTAGLVQRGLKEAAIRKIIGGNVMRVLQKLYAKG